MSQTKILLISVIFIGTLLLGVGIYLAFNSQKHFQETNSANTIQAISTPAPVATSTTSKKMFALPANQTGWQPVGSGNFTLKASGTIDYGGEKASPDTGVRIGDATALVSGIPFGTLVGKIGENGKPFKVGSVYKFYTTETVYIAINDSDYSDNSGSYTITIEK